MSKITNQDAAPHDAGSVEQRLTRLLDAPFLARVVPHLSPETLHQLIRSRGLDACHELVTSATPAQLASLLDLDLWRGARPGGDDHFDVDRFGEWLEVLVDNGSSVAARTVAALDKDVVIAGLARYVRVFDPGIFEPVAQSDDEVKGRDEAMHEGDSMDADAAATQDSSGDGLECEIAGYIVRARRSDAWDAIITLLVALDAEHGHYFHAVMQGCRSLSDSRAEFGGLDDLLPAPEQHLHDVAIERERRRSQQGYATPADARAFLAIARQPELQQPRTPGMGAINVNPIVRAYFRAADDAQESPSSISLPAATSPGSDVPAHATGDPDTLEAVMELLTEAGVMPERPRALLEAADDPQADTLTHVRRLMAYVHATDGIAYVARSRELAFLANTLVAGCSVQARSFTPQEASDAAAAICNLGLEYLSAGRSSASSPGLPDSWLIDHDLAAAFEVGWSALHRDVSLFVAKQLISLLSELRCVDRDTQREVVALRRVLVRERDAGTLWRARDAAEVLAMLDMTVWISVLGLLDECPILPAALTAVLEGRTGSVSPTAFDFISTVAQILEVQAFMKKVPDLLTQ